MTYMQFVDEPESSAYSLPDDALRHLPLLIEAAKGIVNVYTWRGSKGYTAALQQGVAELQAALKPFLVNSTDEEVK